MALQRNKPSDKRPIDEAKAGAFLFMWEAPRHGFILRSDVEPAPAPWTDERDEGPGPWIVERQPVGKPREVVRYAPLARQRLHRDFAALDGEDDKQVLAFANEHGHLGGSQPLLAPGGGPRPVLVGESIARWRRECRRLRTLLDLWDVARGADNLDVPVDADLEARIVWHTGPPRRVDLVWPELGGSAIIARDASLALGDPGQHAGALAMWTDEDLAAPARFFVCEQVNAALRSHASPAVLPDGSGELAIVPHNLLAAFYALFAMELSGRAGDMRRCEYCHRYFYPGRTDQRFCGASCRKKHHYHAKGATS